MRRFICYSPHRGEYGRTLELEDDGHAREYGADGRALQEYYVYDARKYVTEFLLRYGWREVAPQYTPFNGRYGFAYCPVCDQKWELDDPVVQDEDILCDCGYIIRLGECDSEPPSKEA